MKKFFIIALTAVLSVMSASAQEKCCANGGCCWQPTWYVQAQGGVQLPYSPGEATDRLSPVFGLNIGRQVTPLVGVRLGVEGYESKVQDQFTADKYNKFNYYNASFDATLNVVNVFSKKPCHPVNFYLLAGAGYSWSEATLTSSTWFAPSCRVGAILEAKLSKNVALSLEHRMTNTSTQWNGRIDGAKQHDWYSSTMLGIAVSFGGKKVKKAEPEPEPYVAPAPVVEKKEAPAPVVEKKPEPKPEPVVQKKLEEMKECVFFTIGKTNAKGEEDAKVAAAAEWLKNHPTATAEVSGYADKGTGTASINKRLAAKRATEVANKLKAAGISADRISVASYGDTVQPFAENDKNRVVIIVAAEQ